MNGEIQSTADGVAAWRLIAYPVREAIPLPIGRTGVPDESCQAKVEIMGQGLRKTNGAGRQRPARRTRLRDHTEAATRKALLVGRAQHDTRLVVHE